MQHSHPFAAGSQPLSRRIAARGFHPAVALALGLASAWGCAGDESGKNESSVGADPSNSTSDMSTAQPPPSGTPTTASTPPPSSPASGGSSPALEPTPSSTGEGGASGSPSPAPDPSGPTGAAGQDAGGTGGAPAPVGGGGGGGSPVGGMGGAVSGAGGAAGSDGGGAGGAAGEPSTGDGPCPTNGDPCKILPLGDSITEGIGMDLGMGGGYRAPLFGLAVENGKNITFIGRRSEEAGSAPDMVAGMAFPKNHEGYSGYTIQEMMDRVIQGWPYDGEPHIILLHIGTNDIVREPEGATGRLGTIIDTLVAGNPQALLVVAQLIPLSFGSVDSFNSAVPGVVQERIDAGHQVVLVDQFTGFPTSELGDGVHPNETGYARMAGVWYEAIESYLP